jgi:hypothetical protein
MWGMRSFVRAMTAGALCAALSGCVVIGPTSFKRHYSTTFSGRGLQSLTIKGYNGDVHAYGTNVTSIEIDARIETNDLAALPHDVVAISRKGDGAVVTSLCSRTNIALWRIQNCGIDYDIRYPKTVALTVAIVNGDVTVTGAAASIDAQTTNGDVTVRGAATTLALGSHEGDVTAWLAPAWRGSSIVMSTRFGDVRLNVPDGFRGDVRAHTVAGDIRESASVPSGPASVDLSTTFGDVTVAPSQ